MMRCFVGFVTSVFLVLGSVAHGEEPGTPDETAVHVMILGTYHFQASDSDLISVQPADVRSELRQKQLDETVDALIQFSPTVIATERVSEPPDYVDQGFQTFDETHYATSQNERVQLAYRLAAAANVSRVYGIDEQPVEDEPDYFPFDAVMAHAMATDQAPALQRMLGDIQSRITTTMKAMDAMHVAEALYETNTGFISSPELYYELLKFDAGEAQPGAELNAYWFMRNAKIFSKLMDVTEPGDRVIVLFGAGHKFWLEHLVEQMPNVALVKPDAFLLQAFPGQ
ncbi:MAG: DUF5694 domain-containing protein [Pseudomonadota bacterium]